MSNNPLADRVVQDAVAEIDYPKLRVLASVQQPLTGPHGWVIQISCQLQDRPNSLCPHGELTDLTFGARIGLNDLEPESLYKLRQQIHAKVYSAVQSAERHEADENFKVTGEPLHWPHPEIPYAEAQARHAVTCRRCQEKAPARELTGLQAVFPQVNAYTVEVTKFEDLIVGKQQRQGRIV